MLLKYFSIIASVFTLIGALNWGAYGMFDFNPVRRLFGRSRNVERALYTAVGIAGLLSLFNLGQQLAGQYGSGRYGSTGSSMTGRGHYEG